MTLFTELQAAQALCIPEKTLRNARYRHKIAYVKYGKEVRYSQKHLDDYTAACERRPGVACQAISSSNEQEAHAGRFTGLRSADLSAAQRGRLIAQKLRSSLPISS